MMTDDVTLSFSFVSVFIRHFIECNSMSVFSFMGNEQDSLVRYAMFISIRA